MNEDTMREEQGRRPRTWTTEAIILGFGFAAGVAGGLNVWRGQSTQPGAWFRSLAASDSPQTALITGASSGIGEQFARHLAAEGFNLLLVARREARLNSLAGELQQHHGINARVCPADLATPGGVAQVEQRMAECDNLSMVINNAGLGTTGTFAEIDIAKQLAMVHVHINASMRLSRAALPRMIAQQRGAIINVSSIAAYIRAPSIVTYAASKNFLNTFSEALQTELADTGIVVQALCPGFTITEFHDTPEFAGFNRSDVPIHMWMSADEVVRESLDALGNGQVIVIPGMRNRMMVRVIQMPVLGAVLREIRQRRLFKNRQQPAVGETR